MGSHRSFLRAWYAHAFLHELIPIYPLYAVMFGEYGVTPYQLSLLLSVWCLASVAVEVPSGALADKYSRRWLLVVAGVLKASAYAVWLVFPCFWGFLAGFVVWGFGGALRSGTSESLLHDTLREWKSDHEFTKIYGRGRAAGSLAIVVAMAMGAWLIRYDYPVVLLASVGLRLAGAGVAAVCFHDPSRHGKAHEAHYLKVLFEGLRESVANRAVLFVVLLSCTLLSLSGEFDEFIGPVLYEQQFSRAMVAALLSIIFAVMVAGNLMAHRVRHTSMAVIFAGSIGAGAILLLSAYGGGWSIFGGMAVYFAMTSLVQTLFSGRLQHAIEGTSRATVTSVSESLGAITGIAILQIFGGIANGCGMRGGVLFVAWSMIVLSLAFMWLARRWGIDCVGWGLPHHPEAGGAKAEDGGAGPALQTNPR
jgi:MFS family permease